MNGKILTAIYTACICIAFSNYINLKSEMEFLQYWIKQYSESLAAVRYHAPTMYPEILALLEGMKWQYFLVLSRFLAITILCVGFAILCLWKMEVLKPRRILKGRDNHLHIPYGDSLLSVIRNKKIRASTRTRISTVIYTACICIAFLNFIALKNELECLPRSIEQEVQILPLNRNLPFLANLESLKLQYALALSQFLVVTILCTGFALMCQWKMEALQPKPQTRERPNQKQPSPLRLLKNKLFSNIHRTHHGT